MSDHMRIRILSDLHQEFGPVELPRTDVDLTVLPGDIATKLHARRISSSSCARSECRRNCTCMRPEGTRKASTKGRTISSR